jgi:hypothetical protein
MKRIIFYAIFAALIGFGFIWYCNRIKLGDVVKTPAGVGRIVSDEKVYGSTKEGTPITGYDIMVVIDGKQVVVGMPAKYFGKDAK